MSEANDEPQSNADDFNLDREGFSGLLDQYPNDDELADDLSDELRAVRIRNAVREYEATQAWTPPAAWPGTAAEQLAEAVPEIDWILNELFPAGISQLNAQQKAGKTTLALNLLYSLLTNKQFLARFKPNFGADEAIGYLNLELDKPMFLSWLADFGLKDELKRLHIYHAREKGFGRPDLRSKPRFAWFVEWITTHNITVLVIDTLSKLYDPSQWGGGSDPNLAYNRFWQIIENLKREAQLRGIFILHHTGYSEDGADRARGASAMMDNPDVNLTYRHSGLQGGAAPDSKRWLSANGRIEPVAEFEIDFSLSGRKLFATGTGNKRGDIDRRKKAVLIWEYLDKQSKAGNPLAGKTELLKQVGLPYGGKGLKATSDPILQYAIDENWILLVPNGNRTNYGKGIKEPPADERTVIPANAVKNSATKAKSPVKKASSNAVANGVANGAASRNGTAAGSAKSLQSRVGK